MKLHYLPIALAACLSTVVAQGLDALPDCAKECATGSIPKQCSMIDISCICSDKSFLSNISCCVATKCSKDKQDTVIQFANQLCSGAGVKDLPKSATCASGSSSATETSSGSSEKSTDSASSTGTGKGSDASTTSASDSSATSATSSGSDSTTGSSTASATSASTSTAGAAFIQSKDTGLLAAVGAALFAFLA